ncbi:MAG: tetratricopeptide repeat protein [Ruminococcus flavefaciens]|nr:tetratricopeptide repeat protein [Ruminococcus flavefaciens]
MNQENYTEAMINAESAFSNENYVLALEWFRKALEENPNDLQALSRAGTVCVPLDKFNESFEYFQKAMELDPENGDNAFNLGNAYFFHGDYGKAFELYAEAEIKGCSEEAKQRLYYQMAMLCSVRQDVKAALANFKKYEDSDKTGLAALNPDVISEKIKLYMMAEDYENAAKCAVQWITVSPTEINGYMVYFSILMAKKDYSKAEKVIEDAEKYAEIDEEIQFSLKMEKVALLVAKADTDPSNAVSHLQCAYDMMVELRNTVDVSKKDEVILTSAEVCMKMTRYDEAIALAESLIPNDEVKVFNTKPTEPIAVDDLSEIDIEAMAEEDMAALDERIAMGEISEDAGDYAEVYYDEYGNPVREYPEGTFADLEMDETVAYTDKSVDQKVESATDRKADFYDRLYFILLSCYAAIENYQGAYKFGGLLKHSENIYYSYFGRYIEAFSMKKLSESDVTYTKDVVDKKYAETIAFYRSKMLQNPKNNFAVIFRARMYAESGKFAKAEEMANLLVMDEKEAVMEYIEQCRKEYQSM